MAKQTPKKVVDTKLNVLLQQKQAFQNTIDNLELEIARLQEQHEQDKKKQECSI